MLFMNTKCRIRLDKMIAKMPESGFNQDLGQQLLVAAEDSRAPRL